MALGIAQEYELSEVRERFTNSTTKLIQQNDVTALDDEADGTTSLIAYKRKTFRQRWGGRKLTLCLFAIIAFIVLLLNVAFIVYSTITYSIANGYGVMYRGNCTKAGRLNFWSHLVINVLSTLLLLGSNAFMQAYSAPTRKELDTVHAKRKWLHIGVLSLRNLKHVSGHKVFVCVLLAFSSIPFHLLYNSLVYQTLSTNEYYWAVATESFLDGAPFNITEVLGYPMYDETVWDQAYSEIQKSAKTWQNLSTHDCIAAYANDISPTRKNVVLVSSDMNNTNSLLDLNLVGQGGLDYTNWNNWICGAFDGQGGDSCDTAAQAALPTWTVGSHPIKYCLSEETEGICSVNYSLYVGLIVIIFNVLKFTAMVYGLVRYNAEELLTTPGDAVAGFLTVEDFTTWGMCLADRADIRHKFRKDVLRSGPRRYDANRRRCQLWAAGRWTWIYFTIFCFISLAFILLLLALGVGTLEGRNLSASSVGFGSPNANAFVFDASDIPGFASSAAAMAMVANTPQVVISLFAIVYNGLLTSMMLAKDFSAFAFKPQYLMVSTPAGKQRGTYFLGLPLIQGGISIALQALLHFFVSQSLFPVQVNIINLDGTNNAAYHVSNCGYSPQAIYASMATVFVLALNVYVIGLRRLRSGGPPMISTSSAAISAACHVPPQVPPEMKGEKMVYEEFRWGATHLDHNGVGHCSIVPAEAWRLGIVGYAIDGALYAGYDCQEGRGAQSI